MLSPKECSLVLSANRIFANHSTASFPLRVMLLARRASIELDWRKVVHVSHRFSWAVVEQED
jgi:hypothetical protein